MRKKNGWGYTMMLILMGILVICALVVVYYIYMFENIR